MGLASIAKSLFGYLLTKFSKPVLTPQMMVNSGFVSQIPGDILPNPNEVLQRMAGPEGIKYFRRVRQTLSFVAGLVKLRIDAVMSLYINGWALLAGDAKDVESITVAAVCKAAIDDIPDLIPALRKLMLCVPEGVAFAELIWGLYEANVRVNAPIGMKGSGSVPNDQQANNSDAAQGDSNSQYLAPKPITRQETIIAPVRVIDLPPENFVYDYDFNLRFRTIPSPFNGIEVDPMQIVVARYGSAQPYGEGDMTEILPDSYKLNWLDIKGMEILERQGLPMAKITVPEDWDDQRIVSVLAWAKRTYKNFMVIRLGDRFNVEFPNQSQVPTYIGEDQIKRITVLQDSISVGYLGVSFNNSQARHSGNDQAKVKNDLRFEKTAGDAASLRDIIQSIVDKICLVNYPSLPKYKWPKVKIDTTAETDVASRLSVYTEAESLGVSWSVGQFCEDLDIQLAEGPDDRPKPKPVAPIAAPSIQVPKATQSKEGVTVMSANGDVLQFASKADFWEVYGEAV